MLKSIRFNLWQKWCMNVKKRNQTYKRLLALSFVFVLISCGGGGYYEYENDVPYEYDPGPYEEPMDYPEEELYDGYLDDYDQDCADVGEEVWVGDDDPDGLDADGDGWGCESWP